MHRPIAHFFILGTSALSVFLTAFSIPPTVYGQNAPGTTDAAVSGSAITLPSPPVQATPIPAKDGKLSTNAPATPVKPLWSELNPAQRQALNPLASEWDRLDATQKQKWLVIGEKYTSLKPDQQVRLQERMRDWAKFTPEQRRAARENYSKAKKLDASRKSAEWEQYQQLPEETRKKLAAEAAAKNRVANLPVPSKGQEAIRPPKKAIQDKPSAGPKPSLPAAAPAISTPPGADTPSSPSQTK